MTTQTPPRRVFRYGDNMIPDPGSEYSNEQVLTYLRPYYPELGQATIEEKTLADGTVEITFSKQVTTKG